MAKRLIDADALIEKMRFDICTDCLGGIKGCGNCYYSRAIDAIEDAPTVDAVEVVRCKDCENYKPYKKPVEDFDGCCIVRECETDENEFCSYGKRKVSE